MYSIQRLITFIVFSISIFVTLNVLNSIITGNFSFWYDPARDLLSALSNLSNITLLGPPTGIPSLFYGPYWTWLLSFSLFVSKNPRIVTFFVATIPCLVIIPILLFNMRKIISTNSVYIVWLLFVLNRYELYATNLWNPYVSIPLLIALTYVITMTDQKREVIRTIIIGMLVGFILNVHISFGLGVFIGTGIYVCIQAMRIKEKNFRLYVFAIILRLFLYAMGIAIIFIPFLLFELRNNFFQIQAIIQTIDASIHNISRVGVVGLDNPSIMDMFLRIPSDMLFLPRYVGFVLCCVVFLYYLTALRRKNELQTIRTQETNNLVLFILLILGSLGVIYLSSKNPVWDYHFIGVEILYMVLIATMISHFRIIQYLLLTYIIVLLMMKIPMYIQEVKNWGTPNNSISSLVTKERVIEKILSDAGNERYVVFAYNPAIYVYDFEYLLQWKANKSVFYNPTVIETSIAYLIIPKTSEGVSKDFIDYMTPNGEFVTEKEFAMGDGITLIRRKKI